MSLDRVKLFLKKNDMEDRLLVFQNSTATSQMAADELGVDLGQICKTLAFRKKEDDGCILIQMSGDTKIKRNLFKNTFKIKSSMITPAEVKQYTGYEVGGVCAFDIENDTVEIYMDESLKRFDEIFTAGGSDNSLVRLSLDECYKLTKCRGWIKVGDLNA